MTRSAVCRWKVITERPTTSGWISRTSRSSVSRTRRWTRIRSATATRWWGSTFPANEAHAGTHAPYGIRAGLLDGVVAADRTPALDTRLGVLYRQLEHALCSADHLGRPRERARSQGRREQRIAVAGGAEQVVRANLHTIECHLEELLAADRVERQPRDARSVRRHDDQGRRGADPHGHDEIVGDMRVLDEELSAAQASGYGALERDGGGIERPALFHEGQARDPLAGGQRREEPFLLGPATAREHQ